MATRPRSRAAARAADRGGLEEAAAAFLADAGEARYRAAAGLEGTNLTGVYARHAKLFERANVDAVRSRAEANGSQPDARALFALLTDGFVASRVAQLTDAIDAEERRTTVGWRGEQLAYRAVPNRVATIGDRGGRNRLFDVWLRAVEAINSLRAERLEAQAEAARDLGHANLVAMVRATRGWNPDQIAAQVRGALNDSETGYYASMRRAMARVGIEQGDGTLADAWYVLRGTGWDSWFEARRLVPTLEATVATLGLTLRESPGITIDVAGRQASLPRATCVPVRVPDDLRLVLRPGGGWDDFGSALQAAGQLTLIAATAGGKGPSQWSTDATVPEGYGGLLQGLLGEPEWLEERLGMEAGDQIAFLDFHALTVLARLRRLGGQLIYELGLHRGGEDAVHRAMYAGTMGLLAGVTWPEELYLSGVKDGLAVGSRLRGAMLAGSLDEALARTYPGGWWQVPTAFDALRDLVSRSASASAEQVVASLGYDALDWRPVLRKIRTQLIGEMSGYGGPNITTRAGSRKI